MWIWLVLLKLQFPYFPSFSKVISSFKFVDLYYLLCRNLTDASIKAIVEHCPGLCVLDLMNLHKLTDLSIGHLANGCRALHTLKLCRNPFRCVYCSLLVFSLPYDTCVTLTFYLAIVRLWSAWSLQELINWGIDPCMRDFLMVGSFKVINTKTLNSIPKLLLAGHLRVWLSLYII